ncbi:MAG TPA: 50S ribosomal protein L13 [Bacteroidales bacterium]|nr:50S ribosomal protein L13 [Bacteroidales bacterium]
MKTLKYKTISANRETVNKQWFVVDAEGEILGRLAAKVALVLRGKHKTDYTPHVDCGDNVIIINAEKIQLTGNKLDDKVYISHSGYPGGQKTIPIKKVLEKNPERVLEKAIKGMLPKNSLGDQLFRNLYIYVGAEHKQEAQKPAKLDLNTIK